MRDNRLGLVLASALAALCGCDRPANSGSAGGVSKPSADGSATTPAEPQTPLFDGFEEDSIAAFWRPGISSLIRRRRFA